MGFSEAYISACRIVGSGPLGVDAPSGSHRLRAFCLVVAASDLLLSLEGNKLLSPSLLDLKNLLVSRNHGINCLPTGFDFSPRQKRKNLSDLGFFDKPEVLLN